MRVIYSAACNVSADEDVDNEEVYKMANVMAHCGGLHVMLNRLAVLKLRMLGLFY
jgi:E3 ubiquitin-protein ligase UBR4